jgi:molybdopterin-guanine dinucleotide biosynthesis protein A
MGRDKALLKVGGRNLVDRVATALQAVTPTVVVLGRSVGAWPWLADPPGVAGPLGGLVALGAAYPGATLVIAAVDQPLLTPTALQWLLARRRPGVEWVAGVVDGRPQPLPCAVEPTALTVALEVAALGGGFRALAQRVVANWAEVPAALAWAWRDADTPEEFAALVRFAGSGSGAADW